MIQNNRCAKCWSPELLPIPPMEGEEPRILVGDRGMRAIAVRKFVCARCGYIEEWVEKVADLTELRREYGSGESNQPT